MCILVHPVYLFIYSFIEIIFNVLTDQALLLNTSCTILAHEKEINCVTISPNDKLIATASQDKTAKVCH